ncbi:MAG: GNAT family N-acetyltransferase [Clostridia bacterium]|nr:GNAT family N-acetyltransferase [Clostridia bacterium]
MDSLKMYFIPGKSTFNSLTLPDGYSIVSFKDESDIMPWIECCKKGLADDDADKSVFDWRITDHKDTLAARDVFFLDFLGEHIGTVTVIYHPDMKNCEIHMLSIRSDFRGKGLSKYIVNFAISKALEYNPSFIVLITQEWRKAAVRSYLQHGFFPVNFGVGMQERWEKVLEENNIDSVDMYYEDCSIYKKIYKSSIAPKIKIGVVGAGRGQVMMDYCTTAENAELVAICDISPKALNLAKEKYGESIAYFTDYDEFLKYDFDAVVLANFANAHAPFAIKALNAGKHILSEVLPVQTMNEAVELIEAVENSNTLYCYAENYCYLPATRTMRKLYQQGVLGKFEYGEGEYLHNCEPGWHKYTKGIPNHWRNTMSSFYYCTHSIGPLIHTVGLRPSKVVGFELPFNDRMYRMGAKAGPAGIEMITLEDGSVIKSAHGVGISKSSVWYSIYGSKGRMESARDDAIPNGAEKLYVNCDINDGDNDSSPVLTSTDDDLSERFSGTSHSGSDFYMMYNFIDAVRGNRNADVIGVYEAIDSFLPGLFAYKSVLNGGVTMEIPNLRIKSERDKWRNDTECTDIDVAGDRVIPSYSKGNPEIPDEVYDALREKYKDEFDK